MKMRIQMLFMIFFLGLNKAFPDRKEFRHMEGNSTAHLKASCVGTSQTIIIKWALIVRYLAGYILLRV